MGDFNARTSKLCNKINNINNLNERANIDIIANKQGTDFINFLQDNKLALLNGRFGDDSNKYRHVLNLMVIQLLITLPVIISPLRSVKVLEFIAWRKLSMIFVTVWRK